MNYKWVKTASFFVALFASGAAFSADWVGPFTIKSISSSAEGSSSSSSFYRLRVEVNEAPQTGCAVTDGSGVFVYYSSTANSWGQHWMSLLMSAEAQGKKIMFYEKGTCSSIGLRFNGIQVVAD